MIVIYICLGMVTAFVVLSMLSILTAYLYAKIKEKQ